MAFDPAEIFQTSTMGALLDGVYEGNVSIRELLSYGQCDRARVATLPINDEVRSR